jgi:trans-aconitate methyltransferase
MSNVADTWERGNPYERYVGRWSRRVAPDFLSWLGMPPGKEWLDVGCGTGALCAAIVERCAPASVQGVEPSDGFLRAARAGLPASVRLHAGDAAALPLPAADVDVVVAALVLNFVPDLRAALQEMRRVARPGATLAAYVWDYAGGMELIRLFWDTAIACDAEAAAHDEGHRFPLCQPSALQAAFADAGLVDAKTTAIDIDTPFDDFDDYWQPFLGGQGPAPAYLVSLDEVRRETLRARLRERLPLQADGSIRLRARAWAVRGINPS